MHTTTKLAVDLNTGDMIVAWNGDTLEVACVETGDGETLPVTLLPEEGPEETHPFGVSAKVLVLA